MWQFRGEVRSGYDEASERRTLRLIAVSFFVLAFYVSSSRIRDLVLRGSATAVERRILAAYDGTS